MISTHKHNMKKFDVQFPYEIKRVSYINEKDTAIQVRDNDTNNRSASYIGIYFQGQIIDFEEGQFVIIKEIHGVYVKVGSSGSGLARYTNIVADIEVVDKDYYSNQQASKEITVDDLV